VLEKTQAYLETLSLTITSFQETFRTLGVQADELKGKSRNKLVAANKVSPKVHKLTLSELEKTMEKFIVLLDNEEAFTDVDKSIRYDYIQGFQPILK